MLIKKIMPVTCKLGSCKEETVGKDAFVAMGAAGGELIDPNAGITSK